MVEPMRLNMQSFLVQCEDTSMNATQNEEYTVDEMRQKVNLLLAEFENSSIREKKEQLTLKQAPLISVINTCIRHQSELLQLYLAMKKVKYHPKLSFIAFTKCQDKIKLSEIYMNENFSDEVFSVHGMSKQKVKIFSDSNACRISGLCVLPNGQILVADCGNKKVKLLNQQYKVVNHWGVTADPEDICQITPTEVAVIVDDHNTHEVQFITVNQSQLVPGSKFQLQHTCEGIAHHQGDLFIASGTALYKYLRSGERVGRLYKDVSDSATVCKCAVSPTGDKLYITGWKHNKLLTLAKDGTVLATCTDPELKWPRGVHVTPAGQVLVCGWLSHTLVLVDSEGSRKLATLAKGRRDGYLMPQMP